MDQLNVLNDVPFAEFSVLNKDKEIRVGDTRLKLSDLMMVFGGETPGKGLKRKADQWTNRGTGDGAYHGRS